jgi:hypothetical protein
MYALTGKLLALKQSLESPVDFLGDVHIEPHHGTTITGPTLTELARWALSHAESITGSQADLEQPVAGAIG